MEENIERYKTKKEISDDKKNIFKEVSERKIRMRSIHNNIKDSVNFKCQETFHNVICLNEYGEP